MAEPGIDPDQSIVITPLLLARNRLLRKMSRDSLALLGGMMATIGWRRLVPAAAFAAAFCGAVLMGAVAALAEDDPSFISLYAGGYDIIGNNSNPAAI